MRKIYYAVYENGGYIGTHAARGLATMLHCAPNTVKRYAEQGKLYRETYKFVRLEEAAPRTLDEIKTERDEIRERILKGRRG